MPECSKLSSASLTLTVKASDRFPEAAPPTYPRYLCVGAPQPSRKSLLQGLRASVLVRTGVRKELVYRHPLCSRSFSTCKTSAFSSGAEGVRTPDLRRAKAARYFARGFWSLQNACKWQYFCVDAFPSISGDLLGLLHGCCTAGKACIRTRSGMITIGLEGRDPTKEPRCLPCLRVLLPRVVLKEVNITKRGVDQP